MARRTAGGGERGESVVAKGDGEARREGRAVGGGGEGAGEAGGAGGGVAGRAAGEGAALVVRAACDASILSWSFESFFPPVSTVAAGTASSPPLIPAPCAPAPTRRAAFPAATFAANLLFGAAVGATAVRRRGGRAELRERVEKEVGRSARVSGRLVAVVPPTATECGERGTERLGSYSPPVRPRAASFLCCSSVGWNESAPGPLRVATSSAPKRTKKVGDGLLDVEEKVPEGVLDVAVCYGSCRAENGVDRREGGSHLSWGREVVS